MSGKGRRYSEITEDIEQRLKTAMRMDRTGETDSDGTVPLKIFTYDTYLAYRRHCLKYAVWLNIRHPNCATMDEGKKFVYEYLQGLEVEKGISLYTLRVRTRALYTLYGVDRDDTTRYRPPGEREAKAEKRKDREARNTECAATELADFCRSTGLRREELLGLTGSDYYQRGINSPAEDKNVSEAIVAALETYPDVNDFVIVRRGRTRMAPIVGKAANEVIGRMQNTARDGKVWERISDDGGIRSYRREYVSAVYRRYAKSADAFPFDNISRSVGYKYQSELIKSGDEGGAAGIDRPAMIKAVTAIGNLKG